MVLKKSIYLFLIVPGLITAAFLLQPIKKGKGINTSIGYERIPNWPMLSGNIKLGNPTGISIDTNENIVIFCRGSRTWPLLGAMPDKRIEDKTIYILDKDNGTVINSWGNNLFIMPHGLKVDQQNNIWVTDVGLQQVFKFSHDGKLLLKLGSAKVAGSDHLHFNKPTDIAIAKDGSFYVSDGYGNSRIIKFSATGTYLFEWGKKGSKESEFNIPHGIALDEHENIYIADRENHRIQLFDASGKFIKQFSSCSFGAMCGVAVRHSKIFVVDDVAFLGIKHRGSDLFIFDTSGQVQTRLGRSGHYKGPVSWYHTLTIDKDENIYVGDILNNTVQKFRKVLLNKKG